MKNRLPFFIITTFIWVALLRPLVWAGIDEAGEAKTVIAYRNMAQLFSVAISNPNNDTITVSFPSTTVQGARMTLLDKATLTSSGYFFFIYDTPDKIGIDSFTYTLSDGTHTATQTITLDVQEAVVNTWKPPIGIPRPEFGIDETYRLYDDPAKRNPALTYTQNSEGGFYTHYVDNSRTCLDTRDGTITNPRCGIPASLPEGSVVEIHGGPYGDASKPYRTYQVNINALGSKEKPVFIRGFDPDNKPQHYSATKNMQLRLSGTYFIMENLEVKSGSISLTPESHHVSFRNNEIHGARTSNGNMVSTRGRQIVVYKNYIHDNGDPFVDRDPLIVGVNALSDSNYVWVVDNHMHHNGDAFHAGHGGYNIHHVYVGRNLMHHDAENAIDFKTANHFVISQNKTYGYRPSPGSGGEAIRVNDETWDGQTQVWIIFNEIFDSVTGAQAWHAPSYPNFIGNLVYDCENAGIGDGAEAVINNTIYDTKTGVGAPWSGRATSSVVNNVIAATRGGFQITSSTDAHHNILWSSTGTASLSKTVCTNCLTKDPLPVNAPDFSTRLDFYHYKNTSVTLTQVGGTDSVINLPDVDLAHLGIRANDRIHVTQTPEITYASDNPDGCQYGGSTRPQCGWLRIKNVSANNITLVKNIARPEVTNLANLQIEIWHYPYSDRTNEIYMTADARFKVGDVIEYNYDGVARTITQVDRNVGADGLGTLKDRIVFMPAVSGEIRPLASIAHWKPGTSNVNRDFRLSVSSPAVDEGTASALYQKFFDNFGVNIAKDLNGNSRFQGAAWDIGAYEHGGRATVQGTGDVSSDGKVTMYDAAVVLRYTLGTSLSDTQMKAADINADGKVDGADVMAIAKKALGL